MEHIVNLIDEHPILKNIVRCEKRKSQISIIPLSPIYQGLVYRIVVQIINLNPELKAVQSAHSIDIFSKDISKSALITSINKLTNSETLSVGDKGQWPGNDFDLLSNPFSLSVNEVSSDPYTCWNLAFPGHRGVQATLYYFSCFNIGQRHLEVNFQQLKKRYSKGGD